jgi:hypothetical protein
MQTVYLADPELIIYVLVHLYIMEPCTYTDAIRYF